MPAHSWQHAATPSASASTSQRIATLPIAQSNYLLPANYDEMKRLGFQHHLLKTVTGKQYFAPIAPIMVADAIPPAQILDVGCGPTGSWCQDMARLFPLAQVKGRDITPPDDVSTAPANCTFAYGDVLAGLTDIPDQSIDFTHLRLLIAAITHREWPRVIAELVRVTRPGGWIEVVEGSFPEGTPAMNRISQWTHEFAMATGIDMRVAPRLVEIFAAPLDVPGEHMPVRLVNVMRHELPLVCGPHWGRAGTLMQVNVIAAAKAMRDGVVAARIGDVTAVAYDEALAQLEREFALYPTGKVTFWVTYGRRP